MLKALARPLMSKLSMSSLSPKQGIVSPNHDSSAANNLLRPSGFVGAFPFPFLLCVADVRMTTDRHLILIALSCLLPPTNTFRHHHSRACHTGGESRGACQSCGIHGQNSSPRTGSDADGVEPSAATVLGLGFIRIISSFQAWVGGVDVQ